MIEECLASIEPSGYRAVHIGDCLDPEGEQMNDEDLDELQNPEFTHRHPGLFSTDDFPVIGSNIPTIKILLPTEIRQSVRSLHEEQRKVFDVVANFAHQFLRGSNPTSPLIIVRSGYWENKTQTQV